MPAQGLIDHEGTLRCWWCGTTPDYQHYHDHEWGRPVVDDHRLFEKLVLEGFQSGLSWLTILRKRENFRSAFAQFDFDAIARWPSSKVELLVGDAGIVRHRGKIEAAIANAKQAVALRDEFGSLAAYFWRFEPAASARPKRVTKRALTGMTKTPESIALAKDLKRRGFGFCGPTTMYALMQAMGLVDDHLEGCAVRPAVEAARAKLRRPK
ncbi:DNA-3-methyladenine glycosylase I [Nannocystaceae bacterium ST9]